jgi:hypothetical protein
MKIVVKQASSGEMGAEIREAGRLKLPSIQEGWRFNFPRHAKLPNAKTYVLTTIETPNVIEGCLVFQMVNKVLPYMAYVEIAPHNRGKDRELENVGGCLIAYACRLAHMHGKDENKGWLTFDVMEASEKESIRLMAHYSKGYEALRVGDTTTMLIGPDSGEKLIERYLVTG